MGFFDVGNYTIVPSILMAKKPTKKKVWALSWFQMLPGATKIRDMILGRFKKETTYTWRIIPKRTCK